jgi:universal stress protein A
MYKNILLAVDLQPAYDEYTAQKAVNMAREINAQLNIIHCVEPIHAYGATQGYQVILDVEQQAEHDAAKLLSQLADKLNIPERNRFVIVGNPQDMILEKAKQINADLIIVGGHGRHGLSVIFGTTADGIIHHAYCDVLAIRAPDAH